MMLKIAKLEIELFGSVGIHNEVHIYYKFKNISNIIFGCESDLIIYEIYLGLIFFYKFFKSKTRPLRESSPSLIITAIMSKAPALAKFNKLLDDIARIYTTARQAQVRFAWELGRRVVEVEQDGDVHAAYGSKLIPKISKELTKKFGQGFSPESLRKMRQFYTLNPIQPAPAKLDWTDYVELLPIKDKQTRTRLEQRAVKEDLNTREIRRIVQKINKTPAAKSAKALAPLKRPMDLKLNTFARSKLTAKIDKDFVLIDCGFFVNWPVKKESLTDLVISDTPSYTYAATIDRIVDGDTLIVLVEVGFGIIMHDKLRLRGIDCPELGTPEGEKAKRYVTSLLPVGSAIVLKSHKTRTDTHGRFVADVFFKVNQNNNDEIIQSGVYLNQHLLDQSLAVRMKE